MTKSTTKSEIQRTIELLFREFFKKHEGLIELRFISKTSGTPISKFYQFSDINEDVIKDVQKLNINYHVFFGINPRPLDRKKKQEDIKNIVCLWVDLDGKDFKGGKEEALNKIKRFSPAPNIIVDSGNGYHSYWVLKEPIINIDDKGRLEFKRILSGIISKLNADSHAVNLDRVMRLPGTFNIKKEEPLECQIIKINPCGAYSLKDFEHLKNDTYKESQLDINNMPEFGEQELIVRSSYSDEAQADVNSLEIQPMYKKLIVTGALKAYHTDYKTRSERDMAVICALISADYNYPTIRSIFSNQHLGCSERIREKGEEKLRWDVCKALEFVQLRKPKLAPEQQKIMSIKLSKLAVEQKRVAINKFILQDLFSGENPIGYGFREKEKGIFYYFDQKEKWLMDVEGIDFYCFLRDRYIIAQKEKDEILDAIKTEIWNSKNEVNAHKFSYFDDKNFILYLSDHNNGIFKIDGEKITHVDNGTDGVFFEFNSDFTPFNIDVNNLEGENYFTRGPNSVTKEAVEKLTKLKIAEWPDNLTRYGFDWYRFKDNNSFVRRFLIDRANFAQNDKGSLTIDEQKYLLSIYFYSIFFESIQKEKPIVCFEGRKESGKSFIATSIGKILFGDNFQSRNVPDDLKDLTTIMGENYYMVFDNLDHYMKYKMIDAICNSATGIEIERRKLYTDHDVIKIRPRIFLAITTREAKFKRDDLVSRLLLFYTSKINRPISRAYLFKGIRENRDRIMAEVLINLNSIVKLLKILRHFVPNCITRIADWEMFGRKVAPGFPWAFMFKGIFEKLNAEKDKFGLEDDYLYLLLNDIIYVKGQSLCDYSARGLYHLLAEEAERSKITEFQKIYKGPVSLGKRINHIKEELGSVFNFRSYIGSHNVRYYTFTPIKICEETKEVIKECLKPSFREVIDRREQLFLFGEDERRALMEEKMEELWVKFQFDEIDENELKKLIAEIKLRADFERKRDTIYKKRTPTERIQKSRRK
jgi:hypothetical protein